MSLGTFLDKRSPLLMASPLLVTLVVFSLFPLFYAIGLSLTDSTLARPFHEYVGLLNYKRAVTDEIFRTSIVNTIVYAFGATIVETILGFMLALFFYREMGAGRYLRTLALLPFIAPPVAVAMIWRLIYYPLYGLLDHYLLRLHIVQEPVAFLGNTATALPSIMLTDIWQWTPFVFLLSLAALQSLPMEPYEAAAVDGANSWQIFRHLTLPMVAPILLIIAIIRLVGAFKVFDLVYILTFGGPGSSTQVASFYIYKMAFMKFKTGRAAALTIVFLIVVSVIVTLLTIFRDRIRARYE